MSDRIVVMNRGHVEQDAAPEDIFDRPSTPFVADFIGDTNILEGVVSGGADGRATVDLGGLGEVTGSTDDALVAGVRVRVSIRPSDVRVQPADDGGAIVQDTVLVGGHIKMKMSHGDAVVVAHVPRGAGLLPGTGVKLDVQSDRIRVFAIDEA